jgi:hypothetical protein
MQDKKPHIARKKNTPSIYSIFDKIKSGPVRSIEKHKELEDISERFKFFAKQRPTSVSYRNSVRVIRGLAKGLINEFGPDVMDIISNNLKDFGIKPSEVAQVFNKKYNKDERYKLYEHLNNLHRPIFLEYHPKTVNSLNSFFWNQFGLGIRSWLVRIMIMPPQRKITYTQEETEERNKVLDFLLNDWIKLEEELTNRALLLTHEYFKKYLLSQIDKNSDIKILCENGFYNFMNMYVKWLVYEYPNMMPDNADINPGWFKYYSKPMKKFISEGVDWLNMGQVKQLFKKG